MKGRGEDIRLPAYVAVAVAALVVLNILAQTIVYRDTLCEGLVTTRLSTYTDAEDYMGRALRLVRGDGFAAVFRDGIRTPGYPLFLALFAAAGDDPARAVRIAQIVLSASMIVLAWLVLSAVAGGRALPLLGTCLAAIWIPFYYFSPALYAETLSFVCVGLLCLLLAHFDPDRPLRTALSAAAIIAAAVYLKPNQIALLPVLLGFTAFAAARARRPIGAGRWLAPVVAVAVLVSPWTIFLSGQQKTLVPLSTVGGWNLYLGSGGGIVSIKPQAEGSLPSRVWERLELRDTDYTIEEFDGVPPSMRAEADRKLHRLAAERWRRAPLALGLYGTAKVLHSFGFSLRGQRDYPVLLHFIAAMTASVILWRRRRRREWALLLWMTAFVVAGQAFFFLGELRFKSVMFDFPALIVIVLGLDSLAGGRARAARREQ